HYERTETWWEQSRAWHEYLARCQFLLQQGRFVADMCLLGPEGSPQSLNAQQCFISKEPGHGGQPLERPGYNFDTCPPEVVLNRMSVKNGRIVLPDGMNYRVLVLPRVDTMTPRLLRKIKELVEAGATVFGAPPLKSPSLSDYPKCDDEVRRLANELWGGGTAPAQPTERRVGKGRVFWGKEFQENRDLEEIAAARLGSAKWIWRKEGNPAVAVPPGTRYFRRIVITPDGSQIKSASLVMTVDNSFECWVNGHLAGSGDNFTRSYSMNVATWLKPGTNLIAVAAVNGAEAPNPAGLIGSLTIKYQDGQTLALVTDHLWQAAETVGNNWTIDATPTGGWAAALELGPLGMGPWGDVDQAMAATDIFPDTTLVCRLLEQMGVPPDFSCQTRNGPECLRYIHRVLDQTDIYFVANKNPRPEDAVCSFRVSGKRPELWQPDSGRIEQPAVYAEADGCVRVPIHFEPHGSVFVVFRESAGLDHDRATAVTRNGETVLDTVWQSNTAQPASSSGMDVIKVVRGSNAELEAEVRQPGTYKLKMADGPSLAFEIPSVPAPIEIHGPWEVHFTPGWGAPESVTLDRLVSWSDYPDPGVKYYSGTGTYHATFNWNSPAQNQNHETKVYLDLGRVEVMAQVKLNNRDLGILWKQPYRVDITRAIKPGENTLEVAVVNLWINRMIGDEQLPEDSDRNPNGTLKSWPQWLEEGKPSPTGRFTFTSWRLWPKNSPLQPSGLLGPVTLEMTRKTVLHAE
ncbi:MAG: hypothetical protein M1608_00470, partial [Candidatus Omnitrophica bacterium]|nr:hypothetical protein [Candidatus Omnitrophota bacterium]